MRENAQWKKEPRRWNWKASPTIEISSSWGSSRWLPVKWNGPSSCELLHYRNPCAPEEHHPLYGKSALFSYESKGINKEW